MGRREFLTLNAALGGSAVLSSLAGLRQTGAEETMVRMDKRPARGLVAFLYPPADVVNAGKMEDGWAAHRWFTWPGNQFEPEMQERKFTTRIREMGASLGIDLVGQDALSCWTGTVIESPPSPPTGGCATRVLTDIDGVRDVCDIYSGPHPVLFCADRGEGRRFKAFARMYRLKLEGNV